MKCSVPEGVHATPVVNFTWAELIISQWSQGHLTARPSAYGKTQENTSRTGTHRMRFFGLRLDTRAAVHCGNLLKQ